MIYKVWLSIEVEDKNGDNYSLDLLETKVYETESLDDLLAFMTANNPLNWHLPSKESVEEAIAWEVENG